MNDGRTRQLPDPRIERTRSSVLEAVWALLWEVGFDRVTIEKVSERSGVARSTIYRHWAGVAELVMDAIERFKFDEEAAPLGDPEADLRAHCQTLGEFMRSEDESSILLDLAVSSTRDPELSELFRAFIDPKRQRTMRLLDTLKDQGRLATDLPTEYIAEVLAAPLFYRRIILGSPMTVDEIDDHLDRLFAHLGPTD